MKLIIATRNSHKLKEIQEIFGFHNLEVLSAFDFPEIPDVIEDGQTLEENAKKKAVEIARATGCWSMADDSGLEVMALDGEPGIYSARYAGDHCSYDDNNTKLLSELEGIENRSARFRTVIALSDPNGNSHVLEGICSGRILNERRGVEGFGYDPLFVPEGFSESFAELGSAIKNTISHRALALQKAHVEWATLLKD